MMGGMDRAGALAAVALVVGARQEPVALLRRLAQEDPALAELDHVAARLVEGMALPDALVATRLVRRGDAARLATTDPALLAEALMRLAHRRAAPPGGEILAAWFPAWVVLVATLPSLIIGAVVAVVSGGLYGGIWSTLGLDWRQHLDLASLSGAWWLVQLGVCLLMAVGAGALWWVLRRSLGRRGISPFAGGLDRSALFAELLHRLRSGGDHQRLVERWLWCSGDPWTVNEALAGSDGEPVAAFMELGLIPRAADGRPDWGVALAEADARRRQAAAEVTPWLVALLIIAGVVGFFAWGIGTDGMMIGSLVPSRFGFPLPDAQSPWSLIAFDQLRKLTMLTVVMVVVANLLFAFGFVVRAIIGAARDWPLVADRLARAIERREDLDTVLRGLRFAVHRPMRRRLDRALDDTRQAPGPRLAAAGVIPASQARSIAAADGADLPPLLRAAAAVPDDHGLGDAMGQAKPMFTMALVMAAIVGWLAVGVFPKFGMMFQSMHMEMDPAVTLIPRLIDWSLIHIRVVIVVFLVVTVIHALGRRHGWGRWFDGWGRLMRALILRRQLAEGRNEMELACSLRAVSPRLPRSLESTAAQGDLPGLLAIAGWQVRDAASLDRAVDAHLIATDRRRARLALIVRLLLPVIIAVPVGLTAATTMLMITSLQKRTVDMARENRPLPCGGSPGMALIFWWTARCEAQGQEVVDGIRARQQPPPRPLPPVVMRPVPR